MDSFVFVKGDPLVSSDKKVRPSVFSITEEQLSEMFERLTQMMADEQIAAIMDGTYTAYSEELLKFREEYLAAFRQFKAQQIREFVAKRTDGDLGIELITELALQDAEEKTTQ